MSEKFSNFSIESLISSPLNFGRPEVSPSSLSPQDLTKERSLGAESYPKIHDKITDNIPDNMDSYQHHLAQHLIQQHGLLSQFNLNFGLSYPNFYPGSSPPLPGASGGNFSFHSGLSVNLTLGGGGVGVGQGGRGSSGESSPNRARKSSGVESNGSISSPGSPLALTGQY